MRNFTRKNVVSLEAYKPEPQQAKAVLNANENPYNLPPAVAEIIADRIRQLDFNRYPDPGASELTKAAADFCGVPPDKIICGSGLDEILMIMTEAFVGPDDTVVTHKPGFSMYDIWTQIAGGSFISVFDKPDGSIDVDGLIEEARDNCAKIVYVCSPNNPTGYRMPAGEIVRLLEETPSLIVLDEAYVDFADGSLVRMTDDWENLVVLRTLSKAFRLPSARCGWAVADPRIIDAMFKVKGPYNLNALTQIAARTDLENADQILDKVPEIIDSREDMTAFLQKYPQITVYPSSANFIYFKTKDAPELQQCFIDSSVLTKYFKSDYAFRLSIGTPAENEAVKKTVIDLYGEKK